MPFVLFIGEILSNFFENLLNFKIFWKFLQNLSDLVHLVRDVQHHDGEQNGEVHVGDNVTNKFDDGRASDARVQWKRKVEPAHVAQLVKILSGVRTEWWVRIPRWIVLLLLC